MAREDEIKLIAYRIWEEEGCIDGHDCEHWYRGEIIWQDRQKPKTAVKSTKTETKQTNKPQAKATAAKKKP